MTHVFDCAETNPVQVNRVTQYAFTKKLSAICPSLFRIGDHAAKGPTLAARKELERVVKALTAKN